MKRGAGKLFDTIVAEKSAYHDVADDILTEFHPWMKSVYFDADKNLLNLARQYSKNCSHRMLFGTIVTGEQFIGNEERPAICKTFHPLAVDMETAAIAHVCYVNEIPFLAVRTITDTASHEGIENFDKNCEKASEISAEIVAGMLS